jgi:hypothetical protein
MLDMSENLWKTSLSLSQAPPQCKGRAAFAIGSQLRQQVKTRIFAQDIWGLGR